MSKRTKARDRALENDDIDFIRRQLPPTASERVAEMTFHKLRYEAVNVSDAKRRASREWLESHGKKRMLGQEFPLGGMLPR